jgi:hypothetical protein
MTINDERIAKIKARIAKLEVELNAEYKKQVRKQGFRSVVSAKCERLQDRIDTWTDRLVNAEVGPLSVYRR